MRLPANFPAGSDGLVKVCGLARLADARLALELGASFLGFIFAEESPRRVTIEQAREILAALRREFAAEQVRPIGVFVNEPIDLIVRAVEELGLAAVQLHTARPKEELERINVPVIETVRVRGAESEDAIRAAIGRGPVLLDTFVDGQHGGTGKTFDHAVAVGPIRSGVIFLAGGLRPDNIADIASNLRKEGAVPYAFDISSGLEASPGEKDAEKMRRFFRELDAAKVGGSC